MNDVPETTAAHGSPIAIWRLWTFRVAAVLFALLVFVACEFICWIFDWGSPDLAADPFVGFSAVNPLFVLQDHGDTARSSPVYSIPESRRPFFAPESFPAHKAGGTFRIFCLGGSTVQGRPFSKETSFTTWLRLALEAAEPQTRWEVINCGGISYASYRLVPILKECLQYEPDLFIICTGHNEFLEDRTYGDIKRMSGPVAWIHQRVARSRVYTLWRSTVLTLRRAATHRSESDRPILKAEVDAVLDYRGGLAAYSRDDSRRNSVIAHFENNLERMVAMSRSAGVPVLLIQPPSNLCDCPPFKSEHKTGLTLDEQNRWESNIQQAHAAFRKDPGAAVAQLERALHIDDRYALTHYELGKCLEALHQTTVARRAFRRARDEDICPLRILAPMEESIRRVSRETATPLIDAAALLEDACPSGILGDYLLIDHVHPSIRGHQMIANALAETMAERGWVKLPTTWVSCRDAAYKKHFESLDMKYFLQGQRMLDALQKWAAGRVDGPPLSKK